MKQGQIFLIIFLLTVMAAACSKEKKIELSITSHRDGAVVSRPLPLRVKGKITNFTSLSGEEKANLQIYLLEQGGGEKIWHIEPAVVVRSDGTWHGLTWLGNRRLGNSRDFSLCAFSSPQKLKLNDGNHPVKEKPAHNGETCITLKRRDR